MQCRQCEYLERKNIDLWRCRLTGAHLSAEDLDAEYPCPRDVGVNPKGSREGPGRPTSPGGAVLDDLVEVYAAESGRIRALWESGATPEAIAAAVGCSKLVAHYFVSRLEREEARRRGEIAMEKVMEATESVALAPEGNGKARRRTTDELKAQIVEMRKHGATWDQIASELRTSRETIAQTLREAGLSRRQATETQKAKAAAAQEKTAAEKARPLVAALAKTIGGGGAAQFLRGLGSALELLPGKYRVSVRVEEVSEHAEV